MSEVLEEMIEELKKGKLLELEITVELVSLARFLH